MGDTILNLLEQTFTFLYKGTSTLVKWSINGTKSFHSGLSAFLERHHSAVAVFIILLLYIGAGLTVWLVVWPRKVITKQGQPPQVTHKAVPNRLAGLMIILALIFVIAAVNG